MKILVAILHTLLATGAFADTPPTCIAKPLPPTEERTDTFWKSYLNEVLHRCYDALAPEVSITGVSVGEGSLASWLCPIGICTVAVGRELLESINSPEEAIFVVGHEAAHIAIAFRPRDYRGATSEEVERTADQLAVKQIPSGSCYAVNVLLWIRNRVPDNVEMFSEGRMELEIRIAALLRQCENNQK